MIVLTILNASSLPELLIGAALGIPLGMGIEVLVERLARLSSRGR